VQAEHYFVIKKFLHDLKQKLLELVYPSGIYCISCGKPLWEEEPYAICETCMTSITWANGRTCAKCGKILQDWYEPDLCMDCLKIQRLFTKGYSCLLYGDLEKNLIHGLKYQGKSYLSKKIAVIMYDRIQLEQLPMHLIVPVPMHVKKEKSRGYNQAALIAAALAESMEMPFIKAALIRIRDTDPMNQLRPGERRRNLSRAFAVNDKEKEVINGSRVLLIDDVFTTGSTADACTAALLSAGALEVRVLTFAAGVNEKYI
jgi:competence protein ComFC